MIAVAKVPLARDDSGHAIVAVRVRLDSGVRGHEQQDGVETGFCRIAKDDLRMNPGNGRTPNLITVERAGADLGRRHAHLGKGLSGCSRNSQRQSSHYESFYNRSDKHRESFPFDNSNV